MKVIWWLRLSFFVYRGPISTLVVLGYHCCSYLSWHLQHLSKESWTARKIYRMHSCGWIPSSGFRHSLHHYDCALPPFSDSVRSWNINDNIIDVDCEVTHMSHTANKQMTVRAFGIWQHFGTTPRAMRGRLCRKGCIVRLIGSDSQQGSHNL